MNLHRDFLNAFFLKCWAPVLSFLSSCPGDQNQFLHADCTLERLVFHNTQGLLIRPQFFKTDDPLLTLLRIPYFSLCFKM